MIDIYLEIERLVTYALNSGLIEKEDKVYSRNRILSILKLDDWEDRIIEAENAKYPNEILDRILDWAVEKEILEDGITYRDLFDTEIMNVFLPRPSDVIKEFNKNYSISPLKATDVYYDLSKNSNYIRMDRIDKNLHWYSPTEYGHMEITVNLSKPEKDPKSIAAEKHMKASSFPKCLLCKENEGYAGRVNHPARQNHRIIPVKLTGENWFLQYSPYVYYNEHSIIFSEDHVPMKISKNSMGKLLEFVEQFPHYFVGSNADLPIVGGSILSHDHFQGGHYEFPMAKAEIEKEIEFEGFEGIQGGILKWPMSVIRIKSLDRVKLLDLADKILKIWREYSDEEAGIFAYSGEEPHNTITPIARRRDEYFELDLVLRNNRTSEEHPLGIFHPHEEVHNIKKENIGLIEVMGLAVLPGRLKEELKLLAEAIVKDNYEELIEKDDEIKKHLKMAIKIKEIRKEMNKNNVDEILKEELGKVFSVVLEHAGVYKRDKLGENSFEKFIKNCNHKK